MKIMTITCNIGVLAGQIQAHSEKLNYDTAQLVLDSLEKDVRKLRKHLDLLEVLAEIRSSDFGGEY